MQKVNVHKVATLLLTIFNFSDWWTEVKLPKHVYDNEEMLKGSLVIIDECEFRKVFKDYINEMDKKMEQILDEKLDSPYN